MTLRRNTYQAFALYSEPSDSMKGFLRKRWSFWLALFSCVAFLVGNMVGQHGWGAFWKSVWGKEEAIEILFDGATMPIQQIPDPDRWQTMANHTYNFSDVPKNMLIDTPRYQPLHGCDEHDHAYDHDRRIVSVDYNGDYTSGGVGCGSHPAADILVPAGTPVVSAMNGIVDRIEERTWGFGNTIVIKHPNVPDPSDSKQIVTLYSNYAHLGNILVEQGQIVRKGEKIAFSGQSGFATAPHLHFQMDMASAPFHPYWPFTTSEATEAGYSFTEAVDEGLGQERAKEYTVNPLGYVSAYENWHAKTEVAATMQVEDSALVADISGARIVPPKKGVKERVLSRIRSLFSARRDARRAERVARKNDRPLQEAAIAIHASEDAPVLVSLSPVPQEVAMVEQESALEKNLQPLVVSMNDSILTPSTAEVDIPMPRAEGAVKTITILHDGEFHGGWEQVVLFARDAKGQFMREVHFEGVIELRTAIGSAEFSPSSITEEQFDDRGRAIVKMLPRKDGHHSVVPVITGVFAVRGEPLTFNPSEGARDANIASEEVSIQKEGE